MVNSMTGFASVTGQIGEISWTMEIKSVNARGLDVRVRADDCGVELENHIKSEIGKAISRGAVNVMLRSGASQGGVIPKLDNQALDNALDALAKVQAEIIAKGIKVRKPSATEILSLRGVYEAQGENGKTDALIAEVKSKLPDLIEKFIKSRAQEGAALRDVIQGQIAQAEELTKDADAAAIARKPIVAEKLAENVKALVISQEVDAVRLEQELALLAVKADVTEEIDRLNTHVNSAKKMLATAGPIGRKFDFLMQEFNREANTLCSKSGSAELTRIGLDLKTVIDQMREQVQNVE